MRNTIMRILKSRIVRAIINPKYKKVLSVESGNICVVPGATNRLGDLVMNNHFIQQLQKSYVVSHGVMDWYLKKNRDFLENHCFCRDLLVFPTSRWKKLLLILKIRRKKFKAVILLPYKPDIELYFYLAGVPVICTMRGLSAISTHHFNFEKFYDENHYSSATNCILDALGCNRRVELDAAPWFPYKKLNMEEVANSQGITLSMHIGGATYWLRRWPSKKYLEIGKLFLNTYEGNIFLVGGKDEFEENEKLRIQLIEECNAEGRVLNFCGVTLNKFANVLAASDIFIGNDSGPMHVATALKKRVICIFGPSNIPYVNPTYVDKKNITIYSDLACIPCNEDTCRLPADKQYSCLNDLATKIVWKKLRGVIEETSVVKLATARLQTDELAN